MYTSTSSSSDSYSSYESGSDYSTSGSEDSYGAAEDPRQEIYRSLDAMKYGSSATPLGNHTNDQQDDGDQHHHHHSNHGVVKKVATVAKGAVKGAVKVAPVLLLEPKLDALPELKDLACEREEERDEELDWEREYMKNGLSAMDLKCPSCGGRMTKKKSAKGLSTPWRESDAKWAQRRDQQESESVLELECGMCGHSRTHRHKGKNGMPTKAAPLDMESIVLPETQPLDASFWSKVKKGVRRLSPPHSSSRQQQQQQPAVNNNNGPSTTTNSKGPRYDLLGALPETEPIETASAMSLDHHLFPHWLRPHHHHHHHHDGEKRRYAYAEPGETEARKFVESNYPAMPIGKQLSQHTVQEYEALLDKSKASESKTISQAKQSIGKLGASLDAMTLDAHKKKSGHTRHFYRGAQKGEWSVREQLPRLELTTESSSTTASPVVLPLPQNSQLQRLATQLQYADSVQQPSIRALLLGSPMTNLAKHKGQYAEEAERRPDLLKHLAERHTLMYNLLRDNELLELVRQTPDVVLMVPHDESLSTINNRVSDETASLLRYHAVVVPVAQPIREVQGMVEYATLDGTNRVQVENRGECYFVNGHKLRSDIYPGFASSLFHIAGLLSPAQLVDASASEDLPPPMDAPPELPAAEEESDSSETSAEDAPVDTSDDGTATESLVMQQVASLAVSLRGYSAKSASAQNPVVGAIALQMSRPAYLPQLDLKGYLDSSFAPLEKATLTVRTYNTEPLFRQYEARTLPDLARLRAHEERPLSVSVDKDHQRKLDVGSSQSLAEYSLDSTSGRQPLVKKADLLVGITELSFPSRTEPGKLCVLRCRMQGCEGDPNLYMSEDETVLLRFKGNALDTVAVNTHSPGLPLASAPHHGAQYLELVTDELQRRELYAKKLSREDFAQMLLAQGKLMRVIKKKAQQAKKKVTHATRHLLTKAQREKKRLEAMRVHAVPLDSLPLSDLDAFEQSGVTPVTVPVTVTVYDKNVQVAQGDSLEQIQAQKYRYKVGAETITGYALQDTNALAQYLGKGKNGQYVDVRTNLETASFNFVNLTLTPGSQAYYGVKGQNLYVLQFGDDGRLVRLLILQKHTKVIRGLAL